MNGGGVGFSKYSMLVVLALALVAFLWVYAGLVFTGFAKWLLWALGAVCVCAGLVGFTLGRSFVCSELIADLWCSEVADRNRT
jgi:hypothetical protein